MEMPTNMKCYQYGNIRMFNGDCLEFMQGVPDKHYDLAIVDPPYGIKEDGRKDVSRVRPTAIWNKARPKGYKTGNWDNQRPGEEYFELLFKKTKNQIVWGGNYFELPVSPCWVVWDKKTSGDFADAELAWTSFESAVRVFEWLWSGFKQASPEKRIHPTQKPVALYRWLLENYAKPGDKILDTHGGSGSIVIACHALGFPLDWVELDPDYYEAAVKRFKQHLGKPEEMNGTKFDAPPQLKMFTE